MTRKRSFWLILFALVLNSANLPWASSRAQTDPITLSLAVPSGMKDLATSKLAKDYEAANPGIKINVVDQLGVPYAADGLDAHFNALEKYANSADVVYLTVSRISPAATRAGYFLDLAPLVATDKSINTDDFYPAIWQSYQWDNGIWALPSSAQEWVLNYDPAAFDMAGLTYPTDNWTLDEFISAVRKLTVKDATGNVITPGFAYTTDYSPLMLFRSLIGVDLFDVNTLPNAPQFDKPSVEALLDGWSKLEQEGMVGRLGGPSSSMPPMTVSFVQAIPVPGGQNRKGVLLPGGKSAMDTRAFALSAGTQHPTEAYALARWLTQRGDIPYAYGHIPARKSLVTFEQGSTSPVRNLPPELQALIERGLTNTVTVADMRFTDYLRLAINKMETGKLEAKAALQAAETQAVSDLQIAQGKKGSLALAVNEPAAEKPLAPGKIALTFDVYSLAQPIPNKAGWEAVFQDFADHDPLVGQVHLISTRYSLDLAAANSECFYLPANAVPGANLSSILNIDPLMAADKSFDSADMIGNVLTSVQRDNKTWAMPLVMSTSVLQYDSALFNKLGLPDPATNWTMTAFQDALKSLKAAGTGTPPLSMAGSDDTPLLILIAAQGGLPLDYRTDPPTINYSDSVNSAAIRQVLDLVKQGNIKYVPRGANITPDLGSPDQSTPLFPDTLNAIGGFTQPPARSNYRAALYPVGSQFSGIGYTLGAAYISAQAHNPEACYRLIHTLAQHPELFLGMPVRHSQLGNPQLKASLKPDVLALYDQIESLLKSPNTVAFPIPNALSTPVSDFLLRYWLYQAFDSYILKDADLDAALKDAEGYAKGYQACAASLPNIGIGNLDGKDAIKPYVVCAEKADERLKPILDPLIK